MLPARHIARFAQCVATAALAAAILPSPAPAQETITSVESPLEPVLERTMNEGLPSMTAGIKKVAIGSTGATVTLAAGEEVLIDLTGLTGAAGGTNYLGLGMLLFGLSVLARLLTTVSRIMRPFSRRRERGWDE